MFSAAETSPSIQFAASLRVLAAERAHGVLEVGGELARLAVSVRRVVRRAAVVALEARLASRRGSSGIVAPHALDPVVVDDQRRQVRIREVAVVLRVFLAAHRARLVAVGVVQARLLHDRAAVLDQLDLAAHLEVDRLPA